ncbi:helix-turn-helix transcriptional regulator [Cytobacillus gottheilii]|uniref:helix-turn-helix transcriptional regulator n=1 Tax=Cytobacillus gottheilii TaxID=859144 RepID=UPI0024943979|nr:helix-turn-helix domain-containing protein [Cytobacillus gottheilii]
MENNWYTQAEVAKKLGVSKATVYHYAKEGKIKKIPDPHRIHRNVRYETSEVDELAKMREEQPKGRKPSELAKELGMSVQSILKHIRTGTIVAKEVPFGDERISYIFSDEQYIEAKKKLTPKISKRIRKTEYYNADFDIALFQLFRTSGGEEARVTKEEDAWGFYLVKQQTWVPFQSGISDYQLSKRYPIHQDLMDPKGYVHFEIPFKEETLLYPFIDYLYEVWGVENVRLREKDETVYIYIKSGNRPFNHEILSFTKLLQFVIEGHIYLEDGLLVTESTYTKTSLELPKSMHERVKKEANAVDLTYSQWVEKVIKEHLANNQHDKYKL